MLLFAAGTVQGGEASAAAATHQRQSVLVFGDSLSWQSSSYLRRDFNPTTTHDYLRLYPGTALCDWFPEIDKLSTRNPPDVVVLQFFGNHSTKCIATSPDFVAQYGRDLRTAIAQLLALGVKGIVVDAGPTTPIATWRPSLIATYRHVIASFHSKDILYAGSADFAVESPTGGFVTTLQCLPVEVKYHKCFAGSMITVRATDKVHFCPTTQVSKIGPCPVYASGAYRFAHGLAGAVWTVDPATKPAPGT
jgi:hypothetical protein